MSLAERERLSLALVTPRLVRGDGQGRVNYEIVRYALGRGANVTIVTTELAPDLIAHERVVWIRGGFARLPTSLLRSQFFAFQAGRWFGKHASAFDVVQSNGSVTLAVSDVNTAHFVHGAWARSEAHPARYYRNYYGRYHRLLTALHSAREKRAYGRARHVVAISKQVESQLVAIGVSPEKLSVIYNGVDTKEFEPGKAARAQFGLPEKAFVALFAGDMTTPRKNLETALAALEFAPGVHLAVVGSLAKNPYPARAAAMGFADRVTFLGFRRDLPRIMQAVDAFVYPSRYEPLGLVVLEALAAGLPVVTVRATAASELIGPEAGFVIENSDDARAVGAALGRLAADDALRSAMARSARSIAEHHTWTQMSERYYELYERVACQFS